MDCPSFGRGLWEPLSVDGRARLLAAGLAVLVLVAVAVAGYPAAVFGTDESALSNSVNEVAGDPEPGMLAEALSCRQSGRGWRCGNYAVDVDWRGCWRATPAKVAKTPATRTLTGCIGLSDLLGLSAPSPKGS
jgi:hypothetical protein